MARMDSAEAPPRAPDEPRAGRPLSAAASLGVAAITGAAVFAAGVYIAEHRWPGPRPHPSTPQASSAASTEERVATASPAPAPRISAPPAPTAVPPETTAAPTTVPTARPARAGYGSLEVLSSAEATVYVNGIAAGPTHRPLEVRCGRFFLRLGAPTPHGTKWLGPGKTVLIECEAASKVAL
jgi:hypothetical protein